MNENGGNFELRIALKLHNFSFALNEQSHRWTLNATSRFSARNFLPDDWTELKTNQSIKNLPGLLRLNQIHINGSRILNCISYGVFGDLVEDNSLSCFNWKIQHLTQMPSNGLSFAVFIGCEPDVFLANCLDVSL